MFTGIHLCILNNAYATTHTKTTVIYGLNDNTHLSAHAHQGVNYKVQLASFSNQHNADQYRKSIAKLTSSPVHMMYTNGFYRVFVGPFSHPSTLHQIKRELASKTPQPLKITKPSKQRPTLTTASTTSTHHVTPTEAVHPWKDMPESPVFKAGPYVGASIGPRINMTGVPLTYIGAEGTLSAGWGRLWNQRYYLAAEIFGANSANLNKFGTFREGSNIDSVRSTWNYGLDIIPGLMLNDKMFIYARGGVVQTRMIVESQYNSTGMNANGWRTGVGVQGNVYKNLDLRLEYIFALYQKPVATFANEGTPFSNQGNLGLVYKFG